MRISTPTKVLAGALLAAAAVSTANVPADAASRPVTSAAITKHFSLKAGHLPENIVLAPHHSVDVTFAASRQIANVDRHGRTRILATLPKPSAELGAKTPVLGFPLTTGLVRTADGTLYVLYATGDDHLTGLWKQTPGHAPHRIAALPSAGLPNGLVLDTRTRTFYVADSVGGTIYSIPFRGGHAQTWLHDDALASTGFLGVNGLKIRGRSLYASNLDKGTILQIGITRHGAGTVRAIARNLKGVDDFAFTGRGKQIVAALDPSSEVVLVSGSGHSRTILTSRDGLSNPTSVAVRGNELIIPSAAYVTQKDPNLVTAHLAD